MDLFYSNQISADTIELSEEESRHCIKVLRHTAGELIQVVDGKGNLFTGAIAPVVKNKNVQVHIQTATHYEASHYQSGLHLAIAPTKNTERIEWLVEKCVELGLGTITFLSCAHSERTHFRLDRLQKIAVSALKQSRQYWLPQIHPPIPFKDFMAQNSAAKGFIAHCAEGEKSNLPDCEIPAQSVFCIGPEGDFSKDEIELAVKHGFIPIHLGFSRLRTETAALYACCAYKQYMDKRGPNL